MGERVGRLRYCDEHRLSIEARLRLFIKVCSAVTAAHQNLVVHRDLKPSNILVSADGEPKLLDFGIAKVMDADAALEQTATANVFFTPLYAWASYTGTRDGGTSHCSVCGVEISGFRTRSGRLDLSCCVDFVGQVISPGRRNVLGRRQECGGSLT
jgi:serine/threonine protein kinase